MLDDFEALVVMPVAVAAAEEGGKKRRAPKPAARPVREEKGALDGVRDWKDVVKRIRELRSEGAKVPQIAEALQLSYVLVNQVMLQSYQMTVDTLALFERQESQRLGLEAG
jgi:hypothetical protein